MIKLSLSVQIQGVYILAFKPYLPAYLSFPQKYEYLFAYTLFYIHYHNRKVDLPGIHGSGAVSFRPVEDFS